MGDHAPRNPSHDPGIEHYLKGPASRQVAPYQAGYQARSNYPERSVPFFVSDRDGVPDSGEYLHLLMKGRGSYYALRILAGAFGGIALAGLAALASSDSAREFFAGAEASSVAALSVASVAMQPNSAPSKPPDAQPNESAQPPAVVSEPSVPAGVAGGVAPGSVTVAAATPSGDDIKTANQGELQGGAPQAAAVPEQATMADAIHHLDPGEIAALLKRAESLIGSGDLAAARLVLRRAAGAGDARAAMMLGGTYDPTVLDKLGVHGLVPDFAMARSWYEKARRLAAGEPASQRDELAKKQN